MCITISKPDVIVFSLKMFYRSLVQVVDISEQSVPCFPGIAVSGPKRLSNELKPTEDSLNLAWGLHFLSVILWSRPPVIDIVLQVPATDKLLYLILQGDALLGGVADNSVESTKLVLVPLGAISM